MNLSEWDRYDFTQRQKLLADVASVVKNHEMPVPQYTLVHRGAALSESDANVLYMWARVERRRLKAMFPAVPASSQMPRRIP
jgi:Haem-binding domain